MNDQVKEYLEKYPIEIKDLFISIRQIIMDHASSEIEEKMWAKLPSYCREEAFVRLIPFKDHINIEAKAAESHREELSGYKMTPKGMIQIFLGQDVPVETLCKIFVETLTK